MSSIVGCVAKKQTIAKSAGHHTYHTHGYKYVYTCIEQLLQIFKNIYKYMTSYIKGTHTYKCYTFTGLNGVTKQMCYVSTVLGKGIQRIDSYCVNEASFY